MKLTSVSILSYYHLKLQLDKKREMINNKTNKKVEESKKCHYQK